MLAAVQHGSARAAAATYDPVMPDCLFCKIVAGDAPATIVRGSERTVAFRDINPQASTHVLVIPREHHETVGSLAEADPEALTELIQQTTAVAEADGLTERGWRIVFNTGREAQQTVFHVHAHVIGGRPMTWPPG
jgi:histidine triad (HIT) family protein